MKANYRKAFNALKKIGAPVFENADTERDGNFGISAEFAGGDNYHYEGEKADAPDGRAWANYYSEDWKETYSRFGVHNAINDILEDHDCYAEWENCGCLKVWTSHAF